MSFGGHSLPAVSLVVNVLCGLSSALFSSLPSLFFPSSLFLSSSFLSSFLNVSFSSHFFLCNLILSCVNGPWISISVWNTCLLHFFKWMTHWYFILSVLKTSQICCSFYVPYLSKYHNHTLSCPSHTFRERFFSSFTFLIFYSLSKISSHQNYHIF